MKINIKIELLFLTNRVTITLIKYFKGINDLLRLYHVLSKGMIMKMRRTLPILLLIALLLNFASCNRADLPVDTIDSADETSRSVTTAAQNEETGTTTNAPPKSDISTDEPVTDGEAPSDSDPADTKEAPMTDETPAATASNANLPLVTPPSPSTDAPQTASATGSPATQNPVTQKPATQPPATQAPTVQQPVTDAPNTEEQNPSFTGIKNNAAWTIDTDVDYGKYQFLGRGEELLKEVQSKYPGYAVTYKLDGRSTTTAELNRLVNLMAVYENVNTSAKTLTVNIDTIQVRLQCDYTSLESKSGSFIVIGFTTNLPTKFLVSIGAKGSTKGEICQEGITPTGKNGTYTAQAKLTVPYLSAGTYYMNFSIDSGNAGFPLLLSIPIRITKGEYADSEYKLLFAGDWDLITAEGYQDSLTKLFYNTYPRLYKRWGNGSEPKTVTFVADKDYTGVAYSSGRQVVVSVNYANSNPHDIGFFSHEITHQVQQYSGMTSDWWIENMANYGGFRYFHWSDAQYVQVYTANDASLQDWGYEPYGNNKWFFAYMDAKYPTVKDASGKLTYGLIDSINRAIKAGTVRSDDPMDTSSAFNQIVNQITGFDCIESLRLYYVQELKNGTWAFVGFGDYSDNFITENLPNVENPVYPMVTEKNPGSKTAVKLASAVTTGDNLCRDASIYRVSGQVNNSERAELLIDGNIATKWCSTSGTVSDQSYSLDGTKQWIIIDLGAIKTFNTYTIYNTRTKEGYGNMTEWEILVSDDAKVWTSVDYQPSCNESLVSFNVGSQSGRYVMIRAYNPDDSGVGTIRLYEFQLYNR